MAAIPRRQRRGGERDRQRLRLARAGSAPALSASFCNRPGPAR
jgi:hypothetical protein